MKHLLVWIIGAILTSLSISNCNEAQMNTPTNTPENFNSPPSSELPEDRMEDAAMPYNGEEEQALINSEVLRVKQAYEEQLMAIDGVVGVGIQANEMGEEVIWVYLRDTAARSQVPNELEGVPVVTEVTGEFEAY